MINTPLMPHDDVRFSSSNGFSARYLDAEAFARQLHAKQFRKSIIKNQPPVPYFIHLEAVAQIVRDHDGDEDEQIAALLHDSIEDQAKNYPGGAQALRQYIKSQYGEKVLAIVEGCTDADTSPKPPWDNRKIAYIDHVKQIYTLEPQYADSILLVSASDKTHNAQSILNDMNHPAIGPEHAFDIFNGGSRGSVQGSLWYYRTLVEAYKSLPGFGQTPLVQALDAKVAEIERRAPHSTP